MTEISPEPTNSPQSSSPEAEPEEALETAGQTYLADDVTNLPTGEVEQDGPVTYKADHVPEDARTVLQSKVIGAPETDKPAGSGADVQTG